jgi:1-acyl-sn-glycerol-3-phosphate acyltransferase
MGDLWRPQSTCDVRCVTPRGDRVGAVTVAARLVALVAVVLVAILAAPILRQRTARLFARAVLAAVGVAHTRTGRIPVSRALLVANHVSWLDVLVILAYAPARLLAKQEVRRWPVLGRLAAGAGTVFVDRARPKRLPQTVAEVRDALTAGAVVAVFPEGTTTCGQPGGRFRPAMFQAAIDAGVPVVPLRLSYSSTAAAFVGDDTLLASVKRVLAARDLSAKLEAYSMLHPSPRAARRALARAAGAVISPQWTPEPIGVRPTPTPLSTLTAAA